MEKEIYKAGDTNRITRDYFDSLLVEMRHLDAVLPDTQLELFGKTFQTPIMMAALSHLKINHQNGMVEMAKGAKMAGSCMWCGMGDEEELEAILATGASTVKIIKPYKDRELVYRKMEHANKSGAIAVGMDVDHQFGRSGQYDHVLGFDMSPVSISELAELVKATPLPFVVKGVLSVQDTIKCIDAGVSAIVVSHHHGILDYAVPPLMVLPEIMKTIRARQSKIKVIVDCGIESGMDVFKALALGANAVSVGRTMMDALKAGGADGVKKKVELMTCELAGAMARTCTPDVKNFDETLLHCQC